MSISDPSVIGIQHSAAYVDISMMNKHGNFASGATEIREEIASPFYASHLVQNKEMVMLAG